MSTDSSLFRIYVLAKRNNIDFNLASIPDDTFLGIDTMDMVFDLVTMRKLYGYAFEKASAGLQERRAALEAAEEEWLELEELRESLEG